MAMAVTAAIEPGRATEVLGSDGLEHVEVLDELGRGGRVSVYVDDPAAPANVLSVRWAQGSLGLTSLALLRARRALSAGALVAALPRDQGAYELALPFWAAGAAQAELECEVQGVVARYHVEPGRLATHPAAAQAKQLTDARIIAPLFPKLVAELPMMALALRDQLVAVAGVTHAAAGYAQVHAYTLEEHRRRGFGKGVLGALARSLVERGLLPTAVVNLEHEPSVRAVEGLGFQILSTYLRVRAVPKVQEMPRRGIP